MGEASFDGGDTMATRQARTQANLNALLDGLLISQALFDTSDDGGRLSAEHALRTVLDFLQRLGFPPAPQEPLATLFSSLQDLDRGKVPLMLTPAARDRRPPFSALSIMSA
jgi:hypothetical protein